MFRVGGKIEGRAMRRGLRAVEACPPNGSTKSPAQLYVERGDPRWRSCDLCAHHQTMMLTLQRRIHDTIDETIRRQYGLTDVPAFALEVPPTRALGDLPLPVAVQLARALR